MSEQQTKASGVTGVDLRLLLQQVTLKTVELGQVVFTLYAEGHLAHEAIAPICEELLALEKQMMSAPEKPTAVIEEQTAVIVPESVSLPSETAVSSSPPPIPATPSHCPQCHSVVVPGKKFCTTCGFCLIPAAELASSPPPIPYAPEAPQATYPTVIEMPGGDPIISSSMAVPPPMEIETPIQAAIIPGKCITCGVELMPEAAFCTNCGQPIGMPQAPPLASPITQPDSLPPVSSFAGSDPITQPDWAVSMPVGPVAKFCENCGMGLAANVTVCPECGGSRFDLA
jgi:uncharacterized OB-fold protein